VNAKTMLLVVLVIDVILFISQTAVYDINPDGPEYFHVNGSLLANAKDGDALKVRTVDAETLPSGTASVDTESTNEFTDLFNSVKKWFTELPGVSHLLGIVNAVPNALDGSGLPQELSFSIGALWYILTVFLIISYMWGRE
jgi:hypothetical protein